ncbi:hypothetical protein QOM21_09090 [Streptomyces sp. Pv4-95]|uniref:hypothetical protein n=1 Tax=Streptomyces sp. Pv4-95 TaxID=3049543 RepID=UPI003892396D
MTESGGDGRRHLDSRHRLSAYSDLIHVLCPGCGGRAVVVPRPDLPELRYWTEMHFRPRRLVCQLCGTTKEWTAERKGNALIAATLGGPDDPFFEQPLWLQTPCCNELLWAYNGRHVDVLEAYVAARLRERAGYPAMSMLDRLPAWMKSARNRTEVLRGLQRLRSRLELSAPNDRPDAANPRPGGAGARPVRASYLRPPY